MTISALIRAMAAAGAPVEAIAIAVEAIEEARLESQAQRILDSVRDAERRAQTAERVRRHRGRGKTAPAQLDLALAPAETVTPVTLGNVVASVTVGNAETLAVAPADDVTRYSNVTVTPVTRYPPPPSPPSSSPPIPPLITTPSPAPTGCAAAPAQASARDEASGDIDRLEAQLRQAARLEQDPTPALFDLSAIRGLLDAGYELATEILPVVRAKARPGVRTWRYFVPAIQEARERRQAAASGVPASPGKPASAPADRVSQIKNPVLKAAARRYAERNFHEPDREFYAPGDAGADVARVGRGG